MINIIDKQIEETLLEVFFKLEQTYYLDRSSKSEISFLILELEKEIKDHFIIPPISIQVRIDNFKNEILK
jgi:hypothetical protein